MELLKQPLCSPMKLHEQVITLWQLRIKPLCMWRQKRSSNIRRSCWNTLTMFIRKCGKRDQRVKQLSDELGEKILQIAEEFRSRSARRIIKSRRNLWQTQEKIQSRIKSVQDTMKITNAMYMISSSKMKKAKKVLEDTEPYFYNMQAGDCQNPASYSGYPASFF